MAAALLALVGTERFGINLSVPLVFEYEEVLLRPDVGVRLPPRVIEDVLDYHCAVARHHEIFFLWRPFLRDPGDDMLLELAVKSGARCIVTYNERDFAGCERFGVEALKPAAFLERIGELR
jgi:predicted nucleic acid-binding protein